MQFSHNWSVDLIAVQCLSQQRTGDAWRTWVSNPNLILRYYAFLPLLSFLLCHNTWYKRNVFWYALTKGCPEEAWRRLNRSRLSCVIELRSIFGFLWLFLSWKWEQKREGSRQSLAMFLPYEQVVLACGLASWIGFCRGYGLVS